MCFQVFNRGECSLMIFWFVIDIDQAKHTAFVVDHEDGGSVLFRNVDIRMQGITVLQLRNPKVGLGMATSVQKPLYW
jgi:hypothetical protein